MAKKVTGYPEASGPGRCGESFAPDRSRAWSARSQHHGVLQGVQRPDPEGREEHPDSRRDHDLRDRSFTFEMKTPPMSFFLKQAAKIQSGSKASGPRQGRRG